MKEVIMGFIRHALTAGGGAAASAGFATGDEITVIVSGLITLVGVVWSALDKKGR